METGGGAESPQIDTRRQREAYVAEGGGNSAKMIKVEQNYETDLNGTMNGSKEAALPNMEQSIETIDHHK